MRKLFYLHLTLCLMAGVACNKKDNVDPANTNYTVTVYSGYGTEFIDRVIPCMYDTLVKRG